MVRISIFNWFVFVLNSPSGAPYRFIACLLNIGYRQYLHYSTTTIATTTTLLRHYKHDSLGCSLLLNADIKYQLLSTSTSGHDRSLLSDALTAITVCSTRQPPLSPLLIPKTTKMFVYAMYIK